MIPAVGDMLVMQVVGPPEGTIFSRVGTQVIEGHFDKVQPRSPLVDQSPRSGPYDEIQPGMTVEAVEQALGGPHTELLKLQSTGQVDPDTRIWKKDEMTIVVFFNKEGRVIGKAVR